MQPKRLTMEQEKQVRRRFFVDKAKPETIYREFGISERLLRVLVGGPLRLKAQTIEQSYG